MSVSDDELITLQGFAGVVNTTREAAASVGIEQAVAALSALREAQNVDIDNAGKLRRRQGYSKIHSGSGCRGLWSHDEVDFGLFAEGTDLKMIRNGEVTTVGTVSLVSVPSYAVVNGDVIWSDGQNIGKITSDGDPVSFWVESPAGVPVCSAHSAGGLDAGEYQVTVSFVDLDGRESGAPAATTVEVQQGGGIALSGIPQPPDISTAVNVWVSHADGEELYHAARIPAGITSYIIGAGRRGRVLDVHFMEPMPAGSLIAYSHGRLFSVTRDPIRGDVIWYSEPLRYGLRAIGNYITFKDVSMILPVGQGANAVLYAGSHKRTFYMVGPNPDAWEKRLARGSGVVRGTAVTAPGTFFGLETAEPVGYWLAADGVFCIGLPGGAVQPFSERQFLTDHADVGASLVREANGIRQVITTANGAARNAMRVTDSVSVTVYRNGVAI